MFENTKYFVMIVNLITSRKLIECSEIICTPWRLFFCYFCLYVHML